MSDFLHEMSDASLLRARSAKQRADVTGLRSRVASAPPSKSLNATVPGFDVIAEAKLASPSEGRLTDGEDTRVVELARAYAAAGAVAVSVVTEETRFAGSLEHLDLVSTAVDVPVMRKDFLVDPIQVLEARAAGASGVLLIARLLPDQLLEDMTDLVLSLKMFALIEVFDRSDLETAAGVFDRDVLVGVNTRDLASLEVDLQRFASLAPHLPNHLPAVAESGLQAPADAAMVAAHGYRLALIGSSLVTDDHPGDRLAEFLSAGRSQLAGSRN